MDNYKKREFIDPSRGFLYVVLAEHEVKENMLGHENWIAIPDGADCLMHWTSGQRVFYRDKHSKYWNSAYSDWRTVIGYEGIEKMGTLWKRPEQDNPLVTGAEAWSAISKGRLVQWVSNEFFFWQEVDITNLNAKNFLDEAQVNKFGFKYRLKPNNLALNAELPKPSREFQQNTEVYAVTYEFKTREDRNAFADKLRGTNS